MEVHQLRYFLAVAASSNFSRAAERCHVAQPSLSQQIKKLEDEVGARLFERTKREVSLTMAGRVFREHAQRVMQELEQAAVQMKNLKGLLTGRHVVGGLPTVVPYCFPKLLQGLIARHPGLELEVHEDTTAQLVQGILAKEVDIAVVSLPVDRTGLESEVLFMEDLLVALPVGHRLAKRRNLGMGDLETESFVLMKEGHCLAGQSLSFCQRGGFSPKIRFRSAQVDTMLAFVEAGEGVSIVPRMAVSTRRYPGVVLRRIEGMQRSIGLIWRANSGMELLKRAVGEELGKATSRAGQETLLR